MQKRKKTLNNQILIENIPPSILQLKPKQSNIQTEKSSIKNSNEENSEIFELFKNFDNISQAKSKLKCNCDICGLKNETYLEKANESKSDNKIYNKDQSQKEIIEKTQLKNPLDRDFRFILNQ